jgi:hypothetical protein
MGSRAFDKIALTARHVGLGSWPCEPKSDLVVMAVTFCIFLLSA